MGGGKLIECHICENIVQVDVCRECYKDKKLFIDELKSELIITRQERDDYQKKVIELEGKNQSLELRLMTLGIPF